MSGEKRNVQEKLAPSAVTAPIIPMGPTPVVRIGTQYSAYDPERPRAGVSGGSGAVLDARNYRPLKPNEAWRDGATIVDRDSGKVLSKVRWGGADLAQVARNQAKGYGYSVGPDGGPICVGGMTLLEISPDGYRASQQEKLTRTVNTTRSVRLKETVEREGLLERDGEERVDGFIGTMEEAVKEESKQPL